MDNFTRKSGVEGGEDVNGPPEEISEDIQSYINAESRRNRHRQGKPTGKL